MIDSVRRTIALSGALLLATATIATPATPAHAAVGCEVSYTASSWGTGFYADTRIKNLGDPWHGYTVEFTFTGGQRITSGWNHQYSQSGSAVIIRSGTWAPPVGTGDTVQVGFIGSHPGTNPPPTGWRVNGVACSLAGEAPRVIAEPTAVSVPEGGGGSFTVRLSHPPTGPVGLGMRLTGTGIWASPPVVLMFTPTNWSTPQSYPVYSSSDPDSIDDVAVLTLTVPGYEPDVVTFTQLDDD